jgi:hypothetical protein
MRASISGCVALVGLLAASSVTAQPPETEIRVARLIRQLGSDVYAERHEANDELAGFGPEIRASLEKATTDADAEVRLRAKDLLMRLKVRELWAGTPVQLPRETLPASKLLALVGEQTCNRVLVGDQYGSFHEQDVAWDKPQANFWEAIDLICRASGNRVRPHYDTRQPGLVVVAGTPTRFPLAYAGPVRAQISTARRVFTEELDYEDFDSELTHTFQLGLQAMWEEGFRLVAYRCQPEVVQALTDTGIELPASASSSGGWNVAGAGTRQLTMSLRLHPPSTNARELDTLKLKWGLLAAGDMAALDVTDLKSTEPHYQDDIELVVESVQQVPGGRWEVALMLSRDLVIPEPQEVLFQENEIELFDAQGRAFRKQGQTNSLAEGGAKIRLTFAGEASDSQPKTLKFTYPRIRSQRDLEIVFRHVPLPTGTPQ